MRYFNVLLTKKVHSWTDTKYTVMQVGDSENEYKAIRKQAREVYPEWSLSGYVLLEAKPEEAKEEEEAKPEEAKPWDVSCSYRLSFVYTIKVLDTYISLLDKEEEVEDLHGEVARIVFGLKNKDEVTYHQRSWVKSTLYAVSYGMYGESLK